MKKLKKLIEEENAELRGEDRMFLENTLIPKAEANRVAIKRTKRIILVMGCILCCIIAIVLCTIFLFPQKQDFHDTYKYSDSKISEVNENLMFTQMAGEYSSIEKTYRTSDGKAVNFSLTKNNEHDRGDILSCKIQIVVDREYREGNPEKYESEITYLGFPMYYSAAVTASEFNICKINAYFDTGAEQYFIEYERWTLDETDNFIEFLSTIIKNKEL